MQSNRKGAKENPNDCSELWRGYATLAVLIELSRLWRGGAGFMPAMDYRSNDGRKARRTVPDFMPSSPIPFSARCDMRFFHFGTITHACRATFRGAKFRVRQLPLLPREIDLEAAARPQPFH